MKCLSLYGRKSSWVYMWNQSVRCVSSHRKCWFSHIKVCIQNMSFITCEITTSHVNVSFHAWLYPFHMLSLHSHIKLKTFFFLHVNLRYTCDFQMWNLGSHVKPQHHVKCFTSHVTLSFSHVKFAITCKAENMLSFFTCEF